MVMTQNQIRNIIGIIGNVISFGLFLSPVPTFVKIIKRKSVEEFSPIPYLATLLNCMLWVFYGLPIVHPNSLLVVTINGTGLVLEAVYLTVFFIYATRHGRMKMLKILAGELVFMAIVAALVLLTVHTCEKRSLIVGILCIIFCICMYAAPLSVMKMVIQTRSVKYMPLPLSVVSFLNGICWTSYAFLPFDINLVVPNGLGSLFAIGQLILYACYFKATPKEEEMGTKATSELELPATISTNV